MTGYTIYYYQLNGYHSGHVEISVNYTSIVISNLIQGPFYSVSIAANGSTLPSTVTTASTAILGEIVGGI